MSDQLELETPSPGQQMLGDRWGDDISKERKAELEQRLQAWKQGAGHGEQRGPFDGDVLTGADVFWLAARTQSFGTDVNSVMKQQERLLKARDDRLLQLELNLDGLHLEGADLTGADLRGAHLSGAHLEEAALWKAHLEGATLIRAHLKGADLLCAHLEGAILNKARMKRVTANEAHLEGAHLIGVNLEGAALIKTHLERADLSRSEMKLTNLHQAYLRQADLSWVRLERTTLRSAHLEQANLMGAHLEGADLGEAHLEGAALGQVTFDTQTTLRGVVLADTPQWYSTLVRRRRGECVYGPASIADIRWNDADLTVVDWSGVRRLGDEHSKHWYRTRDEAERATRANTQLAKRLRDAGMNDDADRFAYRAQVCQRGVHLLRLRFGRWLFSWLLYVIAGYGYRPLRTLFWYLASIGVFAFAYFQATHGALSFGLPPTELHPLAWYEALVLSVSSFHGRGFFSLSQNLGDPVAILAAAEAVFGLFIEVSFIATFTQRFFGK